MDDNPLAPETPTQETLDFADEIVNYVLNELESGDWRGQYEALTPKQRNALFSAIADAFGDFPGE